LIKSCPMTLADYCLTEITICHIFRKITTSIHGVLLL